MMIKDSTNVKNPGKTHCIRLGTHSVEKLVNNAEASVQSALAIAGN